MSTENYRVPTRGLVVGLAVAGLFTGWVGCSATQPLDDGLGSDPVDVTGVGGAGGATGQGGTEVTIAVGAGGGSSGCDKVDFLFVVDNSVSMSDQQAALVASFPDFINTIQSTLSATSDYHVMVVDTDAETRCSPAGCAPAEVARPSRLSRGRAIPCAPSVPDLHFS